MDRRQDSSNTSKGFIVKEKPSRRVFPAKARILLLLTDLEKIQNMGGGVQEGHWVGKSSVA
jgi:hypothetical protein